jgi:hypothetical protein
MKSRNHACARRHLSMSRSTGPAPRPIPVPGEVNEAISVAWEACEALEISGQHLHFTVDGARGTVGAVLEDLNGNQLDTLSIRQVLRLAGGGGAS